MKETGLLLLVYLTSICSFAQDQIVLTGKILDRKSNQPLPYTNVTISKTSIGSMTNENGEFHFSASAQYANDSVVVSYVGYKTVKEKISNLTTSPVIYIEEYPVLLNEISISTVKINVNDFIRPMRVVRDKLYASNAEVTNSQYNLFLHSLQGYNQALYQQCDYDLSSYDEVQQSFYKRYQADYKKKKKKTHDSTFSYNDYPAINITHAAAVAYCEWLTDEYNNSLQKKKYKKVKFRLPTLDEWRIAALGYRDFQSWKLEENIVVVSLPRDTIEAIGKGKRVKLAVKDEVLYPWYGAYNYRKKAQNHLNCFLGNFKAPPDCKPCLVPKPGSDGFGIMGETASYFPNDIGLYDVVGNVAEMIDEKGKACGGSWNDFPDHATLWSISNYSKPSSTVGFRVFMEVVVDK